MRPLVKAGALVLLCASAPALATPALAATTTKAAGSAGSAVQLVSLTAGGHTFDLATLELVSDTVAAAPSAKVVVTPIAVDGVAYGQQTITPGSGATTVPALPLPAISGVPGVVEITAPAVIASATTADPGPSSKAGTSSLGSVEVLGIPVAIDGAAEAVTGVTSSLATATKTISVTDLSLPSIADVLAGLGLDLSKVPLDALRSLVEELDLVVSSAVATAMAAVDTAQAQLGTAAATLTSATSQLAVATGAVDSALAALTTQLGTQALTLAAYEALPQLAKDALPAAVTTAYATYTSSLSTQALAQTAVATAQAAVDALQATLTGLVATALGAVQGLLDGVPLLSLDSLELSTSAVAKTAQAGGQTATITGGEITGLTVLGTDVLDAVLGSSTVDVLDLTSGVLADVTAVADSLTGTLAGVLSDVAGLELTAPVVDVLGKATRTGVVDGFGEAETAVSALSIQLPRITLPTALQLPGAGSLPAFEGVTAVNGALSSLSGSLDLLTLTELSRFRPAVTSVTPPTSPNAPETPLPVTGGVPGALGGTALLLAAGALVALRRRTATS